MKKIEITDYKIIEKYLDEYSIETSEISFTNIFMWRNKYNFHYEIINGFLWLINIKDDDTYYYSQPIGDYTNKELLIDSIRHMLDLQDSMGKTLILKKCDDRFFEIIRALDFNFISMEIREDFDYVYDYVELKELKGKKYHKKKNHINKFLKLHTEWTYEELSSSNIEDVMEISSKWFEKAFLENDVDLIDEYNAIKEAIDNFTNLEYSGGIIKVDHVPCAFILGERLNNDTLLIHIEKADTSYHGIYPMIFNQYLLNLNNEYKYINREQDLGIKGLRKAKLAYHPVKFIMKRQIEITLD